MNKQTQNVLAAVGAVLILAGVGMYITPWGVFSPYIYTAGAVPFAVCQLWQRYEGTNIIIRRLRRQQILAALLLLMTAPLMFFLAHNEWILCLTVAAILELYTAFRIPQEEAREKNN